MLEHFDQYGYLGVFLALLASGLGFPIPEELPVITAGIMVGHEGTTLRWYYMLPVVIAGVVIGDGFLYLIGRVWGRRLLESRWVQRRLPPEKREQIEKNFHDRGIMVLLGARLLPGIRTPIFIMAGVLRVPLGRFLLADGLYAIPGVNLLFWVSYMLTDQVLVIFNQINQYKPVVFSHLLAGLAGALIYRFVLVRRVSTGDATRVPPIIAKPAEAVAHAVEAVADKVSHVVHPHADKPAEAVGESHPTKPPDAGPPGTGDVTAGPAAASSPPPRAN
jgi:membrane protein DedA with SNARE-associated domain